MLVIVIIQILILVSNTKQCQPWHQSMGIVVHDLNGSGLMVYVDAEDQGVSKYVRDYKEYNRELVALLGRLLENGQSFLHVGGHVGVQALLVAKEYKDRNYNNSHAYVFQPNQLNYLLLVKSIYLNNLQQHITAYKTSISNTIGTAQLAIQNTDTSTAKIMPSPTKRKSDYKYTVHTSTVDSLLSQNTNTNKQQHKIGLAYISCNTYEIQAMLGMKQLIDGNPDMSVVVEWQFGSNWHKDVDGLIQVLKGFENRNYRMFMMERSGQGEMGYKFVAVENFMDVTKIKEGKFIMIVPSKINRIM